MRKHLLVTGVCCGLAFALSATAALAQATDQTTDHQRIKALEARVAALEQRLDMPPATPPATPQPVPHREASLTAAPLPAASLHQPAPAVTVPPASSDWSHLQRGMAPREVAAQIGPPDRKQVRGMSEVWFYPGDRQIEFDRDSRLQSWSKP